MIRRFVQWKFVREWQGLGIRANCLGGRLYVLLTLGWLYIRINRR
jgi:hypothetical protein